MDNKEMLRRKIEYATPEELLFILLNDTESKFKRVIKFWEENNVEGTALAWRLQENIATLRDTMNLEVGDDTTKEGLRTIYSLYDFVINEITFSVTKKDIARITEAHKVFQNIKGIFDTDRKNIR